MMTKAEDNDINTSETNELENQNNKSQKASILVIEDEPTIIEFLKTGLTYEGYDVVVAIDGKTGTDYVYEKKIDLIILDIMLPDIDGFEICKILRNKGITLPILMLTAKREISDHVKGLDMGADDYMTKPFSFDELLARIRALLRRSGREIEQKKLYAVDIIIDLETREVTRAGEKIYLTPTEFSILELFMRHPRRVFTRDTLLNLVLGYNYIGNSNIIDVHVSHLREKIGDKQHKLIHTYYSVGYAFHPET